VRDLIFDIGRKGESGGEGERGRIINDFDSFQMTNDK
jgi:hypothetical protein